MRFDFYERFGIIGFTKEEVSHTAEFLHNNDPENDNDGLIDWSYWAEINFTPIDAAHLLHAVDVDIRDDADTPLPRQKMQDGLQKDIDKLARWLSSKSPSWSLQQLVDTFGAENLNTRMVAAVKAVAVDDAPSKKSVAYVEWLRETWIKEGRLGGSAFFVRLKRYKSTEGSPVIDHWTHDNVKGAGIKIMLNDGKPKDLTKKTIENMVSTFKKQLQ
jgi:hypothetical protein